jgi:hypothetical protein
MGSPCQRGTQGLRSGTWHVVTPAASGQNAWAASAAGYPAKVIGVARSDLEHYADLQATLRPENRLAVFYHSHPLGRYSVTVVSRRIGDQFTLATHTHRKPFVRESERASVSGWPLAPLFHSGEPRKRPFFSAVLVFPTKGDMVHEGDRRKIRKQIVYKLRVDHLGYLFIFIT